MTIYIHNYIYTCYICMLYIYIFVYGYMPDFPFLSFRGCYNCFLNTWLPHRICKWDDVQMKQLENVQVQCRHEGWWHRSLEHPIFGCCPAEFHFTFCACSLVGPPHSSMLQLRKWFFYPNLLQPMILVVAWGSEVVPRFWHHQNCLSWVYGLRMLIHHIVGSLCTSQECSGNTMFSNDVWQPAGCSLCPTPPPIRSFPFSIYTLW